MSKPTPEELAQWRGMCEGATPGPWKWDEDESWLHARDPEFPDMGTIIIDPSYDFARGADADFIASARSIVPRLLDEVEQLNERLARVQKELDLECAIFRCRWCKHVDSDDDDCPTESGFGSCMCFERADD